MVAVADLREPELRLELDLVLRLLAVAGDGRDRLACETANAKFNKAHLALIALLLSSEEGLRPVGKASQTLISARGCPSGPRLASC